MADTKFINLVPLGLTRGVSLHGAYILILREVAGKRCMATLVTQEEYDMVSRAMQGERSELARTVRSMLDAFAMNILCVVLHNNTPQGEYRAGIIMRQGADVRTVQQHLGSAVVLAMELGVPIQVSESYFNSMTSGNTAEDGMVSLAVPVSAMDENLLREAMEQAVKDDDFEMAKTLRDELNRREGLAHISSTAAL